ncbi:hypothetical protein P153DRAFT_431968 [Dothidotthia symphoricarpi CBS 119687]|uniref:Uncharacterized protein n=1 Tax=Dothidotthia symphoricarpi CBS 119687 TaxID=1392245 RepID=A0A6A6AB89_9PLEO|nr:uncharacterized protein P153DRAFT_431968 [Dothidotthia symphoricarpi CBS 119687]KAF2128284.1 hypothetical protein P153DRAFT_431968 [Dothidotthia symphoricarpi CBS 119687]
MSTSGSTWTPLPYPSRIPSSSHTPSVPSTTFHMLVTAVKAHRTAIHTFISDPSSNHSYTLPSLEATQVSLVLEVANFRAELEGLAHELSEYRDQILEMPAEKGGLRRETLQAVIKSIEERGELGRKLDLMEKDLKYYARRLGTVRNHIGPKGPKAQLARSRYIGTLAKDYVDTLVDEVIASEMNR